MATHSDDGRWFRDSPDVILRLTFSLIPDLQPKLMRHSDLCIRLIERCRAKYIVMQQSRELTRLPALTLDESSGGGLSEEDVTTWWESC